MSNIAAPSRRPLISENAYQAVRNNHAWVPTVRRWTDADAFGKSPALVIANQLGFVWPGLGLARDFGPVNFGNGETPLGSTLSKTSPIKAPTNHSGITIVTFCDGHSEKLDDSALCNQFDYLPIQSAESST